MSAIDAVLARILDSRDFEVGGGAAAALAGSMAAALAALVARLSVAHELPLPAEVYEVLAIEADGLSSELSRGAVQDVQAYAGLKAAYALARDTGEAVRVRKEAIERGLYNAATVPLENVRRAGRVRAICVELLGRANPNAASDLAVAVALAESSLCGCARNVEANTAFMHDHEAAQALLNELGALLSAASEDSLSQSAG
jgi:methenyltetrahydrofolate cyclohydrolase